MAEYLRGHDVIAGVMCLGLLVGILALAVLGRECPAHLENGFLLALGWVFRSGVQLQNELRHRERKGDNDDGPG